MRRIVGFVKVAVLQQKYYELILSTTHQKAKYSQFPKRLKPKYISDNEESPKRQLVKASFYFSGDTPGFYSESAWISSWSHSG
jgi:hypothetical protein